MGEPSSFAIVELTGPRNNLVLQGRALPYRPMPFEGTMRAEFTWYPGNPVATVQMLGAKEEPTTIQGMWKDRFLKRFTDLGIPILFGQAGSAQFNGQEVADVFDLVRVVDGFRRRGQLLDVGWDEHTRRGILTRFRHTWLRREDVEWEMEFTWISQSEPLRPVGFGVSIPAVDLATQFLNTLNELRAAVDELKESIVAVTSVVNALNNALDTIQQAVASLSDLANQAVKLALSPLDVARSVLATLETVGNAAGDIVATIESVPDRAKRSAASLDNQAEALESCRISRRIKRAARKLRGDSAQRKDEVARQTTEQKPLATFIATEGQDLRDVSTQFYKTPNEWRRIANYNNIRGSRLKAGREIIVPPLNSPGV